MNNSFVGFRQTAFVQFCEAVNKILAGSAQPPVSLEEAKEHFDGTCVYTAVSSILDKRQQQKAVSKQEKSKMPIKLAPTSNILWPRFISFIAGVVSTFILCRFF